MFSAGTFHCQHCKKQTAEVDGGKELPKTLRMSRTRFPLLFHGIFVPRKKFLSLDFLACNPMETKSTSHFLLASKPDVFSTSTTVTLFQKKKNESYLVIHMNPGSDTFQKVPTLIVLGNSRAARGGSSCRPSIPQPHRVLHPGTIAVHMAFKMICTNENIKKQEDLSSSFAWKTLFKNKGGPGRWKQWQPVAPKTETTFPCCCLHCYPKARKGGCAIPPQPRSRSP